MVTKEEVKHPKVVCWISLVVVFLCGLVVKDLVSKIECNDCNSRQQRLERAVQSMKPYNRKNTETLRQRPERFNREKSNER